MCLVGAKNTVKMDCRRKALLTNFKKHSGTVITIIDVTLVPSGSCGGSHGRSEAIFLRSGRGQGFHPRQHGGGHAGQEPGIGIESIGRCNIAQRQDGGREVVAAGLEKCSSEKSLDRLS